MKMRMAEEIKCWGIKKLLSGKSFINLDEYRVSVMAAFGYRAGEPKRGRQWMMWLIGLNKCLKISNIYIPWLVKSSLNRWQPALE